MFAIDCRSTGKGNRDKAQTVKLTATVPPTGSADVLLEQSGLSDRLAVNAPVGSHGSEAP